MFSSVWKKVNKIPKRGTSIVSCNWRSISLVSADDSIIARAGGNTPKNTLKAWSAESGLVSVLDPPVPTIAAHRGKFRSPQGLHSVTGTYSFHCRRHFLY